jgi:hypothetical protein
LRRGQMTCLGHINGIFCYLGVHWWSIISCFASWYLGISVICPFINFFLSNSNTSRSFYVWSWLYVFLAMFGAACKVGQLVFNTFLVLLVHTWTMIVRKKFGIVSLNSCCHFHSLILRWTIKTTLLNVL